MNTSNPRAEQIFAAALQLFISAELRISTLLSTGRGHALLLWLVLASAASCLTGCATRFSHWEESGHVPDDVKVIRVSSRAAPPNLNYVLPLAKKEGSEALASETIRGLAQSEGGAILLVPVAVPIAAVVGALRGVPEATQLEAERVLTSTFQQIDLSGELLDAMVAVGGHKTSWQWEGRADGRSATLPQSSNDSSSSPGLYELALTILHVSLAPNGNNEVSVNPRLRMHVRVRCEVRRGRDGKWLFEDSFEVQFGNRHFVNWAEQDGRFLREAYNHCARDLAERIVQRVFVDAL